MSPRSGGYYVFARQALGEFPAFVVGWTDWLATCGTTAAASILVAEYAGDLYPPWAGRQLSLALATAVGLALLQARGIRWGAGVQGVASAAKGLALLGLVAAFFLLAPAAAAPASDPAPSRVAPSLALGALLAMQAVIYTYDGWYGVIYFGEEVRQPGRDVPRSMIGGVLLVTALYLLVNLSLLAVLPPARLAGERLAVGAALAAVAGGAKVTIAAAIVQGVAILCLLGGINAYHLMASRIPLAMSRDRLLPPALRRGERRGDAGAGPGGQHGGGGAVHPVGRVPAGAGGDGVLLRGQLRDGVPGGVRAARPRARSRPGRSGCRGFPSPPGWRC